MAFSSHDRNINFKQDILFAYK